ncbi:restriction endonuclease subunit S [Gillisia sp. CAL575]|uniref:restriction endonuclease subunit S n=1 Tax=Gillisia sp. CAL575 TaxID=985255 RepID=UPI0006866C84|nr:restriction endonuclease subunit S [Gillisia sp. CAL575]
MELTKTNYNQTELGLIPEDWNISMISECAIKITDGEHLTPVRTESGYYLLSARNILNGRVDTSDVDYVGKEEYTRIRKRCNPEFGDVLISCSGSIGRIAIVPENFECVMVRSAALIKPENFKTVSLYLQYFLQSSLGQKQIFTSMNQGAQPNLFLNHIKNLQIVLPPLAEQNAIAQVLDDTDKLLQAIEQKLAKKRAIKQGAMQQLLTPKDDWEVKKLTEVVNYIHGKAHENHIVEDGKYIAVNSKFISTEGKVSKRSNHNFCKARKGDVLTVLSDLPNGKALAKCFYVSEDKKYAVNQRICIWRSKSAIPLFLFYLLNRNKYFLKLDDGVTQTHILNHHIEKCEISIPKSAEEQSQIATILSDMDAEIAQLEQKLSKYKLLKQGLMQNLLTGKIRLV